LCLALIYFFPVFLVKPDATERLLAGKLVCWFTAAGVTVLVQSKGWINHYYPMLFFGTFLLSALLAVEIDRARSLDLKRFAALWALGFITFGLPAYHLATTRSAQQFEEDYIAQLRPYIAKYHGEDKPFYVMTFDLGSAFPAINVLPVRFPFHFHHFWMIPGLVEAELYGRQNKFIEEAKAFTLQRMSQDMKEFRPPLLVVDNNHGLEGMLKDFDFITYFRQDAVFSSLWKEYHEVGKIKVNGIGRPDGEYTIYARKESNGL
jgi:hypothetical protein